MNRILFESSEVALDGPLLVEGPRAIHMLRVLRAMAGDSVRVGILDGPVGTALIESTGDGTVTLIPDWGDVPAPPRIDLLLALPRPKVMRRLWAPLASLGVGRIILVNADKVERNYFDTHWLNEPTYRPRLIEGLAQAGDTRLPMVHIERRFKPFIEDHLDALCPDTVRLVAHPRGAQRITGLPRPETGRVLLAIGPEGGWTAFELELLAARGFQSISAGPRTLRTDVACSALLALTAEWLGD